MLRGWLPGRLRRPGIPGPSGADPRLCAPRRDLLVCDYLYNQFIERQSRAVEASVAYDLYGRIVLRAAVINVVIR